MLRLADIVQVARTKLMIINRGFLSFWIKNAVSFAKISYISSALSYAFTNKNFYKNKISLNTVKYDI